MSICSCPGRRIVGNEGDTDTVSVEGESSDEEETQTVTCTKYRNRDVTLSAILEKSECDESKTKTKASRLSFLKRNKSKSKKSGYHQLGNAQKLSQANKHNFDADDYDFDSDSDEDESLTYSNRKSVQKTEILMTALDGDNVNDNEEEKQFEVYDNKHRTFVRKTKLENGLSAIMESPERNRMEVDENENGNGNEEIDDTYTALTVGTADVSKDLYGVVDMGKTTSDYIASGANAKLQANDPNNFKMEHMGQQKPISQVAARHSLAANKLSNNNNNDHSADGSYDYTQTTNDDDDDYTNDASDDDDDVTEIDMTSDVITSSSPIHPQQIRQRMEVISKHPLSNTMQNIIDSSSDSDNTYDSDSKHNHNNKDVHISNDKMEMERESESYRERERVYINPLNAVNPFNNNEKRKLMAVGDDSDDESQSQSPNIIKSTRKLSYSSERGSITPFQPAFQTSFPTPISNSNNFNTSTIIIDKDDIDIDNDNMHESDSDKESNLDEMLNDVLSQISPNNKRNVSKLHLLPRHTDSTDTQQQQREEEEKKQEEQDEESNYYKIQKHPSNESESTTDQDQDSDIPKSSKTKINNMDNNEYKEMNNKSLNTIDEERKLDDMNRIKHENDALLAITMPTSNTSANSISTMSFRSESPRKILRAAKSHRNENAFDIEHGYELEYVHHEQDHINTTKAKEKRKQLLREATFQNIAINLAADQKDLDAFKRRKSCNATSPSFKSVDNLNHSYFSKHHQHKTTSVSLQKKENSYTDSGSSASYTDATDSDTNSSDSCSDMDSDVSSIDSKQERKSWQEYTEKLKRLFYCFAGYERDAKKKGVYMSRSEVKRFLEIVEITRYWSVDEVFKMMDSDVSDNKITCNEFVEYFCDERLNPKAKDIKKHIERQVSWQLLLKALNIFDKVDVDHSGQLEYNEFRQFGQMLNLNEKETELLWHTIDTDDSGQISIVELFEWFKKRLEEAKQSKKAKQKNPRDFSGSHPSFYDDSTDTRSVETTQETNNNNL